MVDLPLDKILGFLKKVSPFSELPETALKEVSRTLLIDYFPKGEIILSPTTANKAFLYLVFSGVARCFVDHGSERDTLRYVAEIDHFGGKTLLSGHCHYTAQVQEDMICYLVRPEVFADLCTRFDAFKRYFETMTEPLAVKISRCQETDYGSFRQPWREKASASQFETSIDALIDRAPVCCSPRSKACEIARIMALNGISSVIVTEKKRPVGIVTKNDLTEKILARQRSSDVPASEIMTKSPVGMDYKGSCFEASLRMLKNRCHHMLAMKSDKLFGVISQHDLILLQGANPIAVVGAVDKQKNIGGLKKCVRDMSIVQRALLAEGGRIDEIWSLMTEFRDTLTRRLLILGIEDMRKQGKEPPVFEFCWLTFGTCGRKETLLRGNFLEGFMYRDPEGRSKVEAEPYVQELCGKVKDGLLACGLLHRTAGRVLCMSESVWRQRIKALVDGTMPLDSKSLRILDFRGVLEQWAMADAFRNFVIDYISSKNGFLDHMKAANDPEAIPTCFYADLVVTPKGFREEIGVKEDVLIPLADAVRALALENRVTACSTLGRVKALRDMGMISSQRASDLRAIYTWIIEMGLRRALEEEQGLDWVLDPRRCSPDEKRLLTESFRLIRDFIKDNCRTQS